MGNKYQDKYLIPSARLRNCDYRWSGAYFVTICTIKQECFFGEIVNGKMHLSEIGKIVESQWLKTFQMRKDMNLQSGGYVVMPNHFHAIIVIGKNQYNTQRDTQRDTQRRDAMHCVSNTSNGTTANKTTANGTTANETNNPPRNQFGPQSKNLASIIRGFKIGVTVNARKIDANFAWQARYHDHIIRDDDSFQKIQDYIISNPKNWESDKFFN